MELNKHKENTGDINIENTLSEKLGIKVDLVTEGAIKNDRIKKSIQKDLQIIYQA